MTTLHAKFIDRESTGRIGRGRGVNHFAALSRARRLSHDIVSRTASTQRGLSGPRDHREKKAAGREEREGNGLSVRFAVSATSATERQKVRPLPNDLSVFVSRLIYEWGPRETEPTRRLSRAIVSISLYLPSRPVVHGGIRATLFSQLAAFSLSG